MYENNIKQMLTIYMIDRSTFNLSIANVKLINLNMHIMCGFFCVFYQKTELQTLICFVL